MARIAGVDLPRNKRIEVALTYIYGIGQTTATKIVSEADVNPDTRVVDLDEGQVIRLRDLIVKNHMVEGDLRREISFNIKNKMDLGSYEGLRHRRGLPVRGQRTKTNARSRKGHRPSIGGRKKR
ncbi:30S ribosomal protein S13 [bacterium]|nr:30S ribosomal protein S13 [bacterium]MDF1524758.1 30S ribosomal protein S13 [bacterium]MDT8364945.1 30S ribosomal protein S13 [bacterium]